MSNNRKIFFPMIIFFFMGFSSCAVVSEYFSVISGNYRFNRGSYQEANYRYLQAVEIGRYPDFISYNLGNVYHDLGIKEDALMQWGSIDDSIDQDLRFKVAFNRGVLFYGSGEYNKAFHEFRKALMIGPGRRKSSNLKAAKKNLELCLQKLSRESVLAGGKGSNPSNDSLHKSLDSSTQALMDIVESQERLDWELRQDEGSVDLEDF